jgi:multiple sugar transport system permease protein
MSPVIFYSLILGIVDVLQYFLVPLVLYNGSGEPAGTTLFFNLLLYKTAFGYQNFAYGSAMAWLLFLMTLAVTLLVFRSARRWVFYAGDR